MSYFDMWREKKKEASRSGSLAGWVAKKGHSKLHPRE